MRMLKIKAPHKAGLLSFYRHPELPFQAKRLCFPNVLTRKISNGEEIGAMKINGLQSWRSPISEMTCQKKEITDFFAQNGRKSRF
ncbi:hypothetical protein D3C80_1543590 [compost metagenome]